MPTKKLSVSHASDQSNSSHVADTLPRPFNTTAMLTAQLVSNSPERFTMDSRSKTQINLAKKLKLLAIFESGFDNSGFENAMERASTEQNKQYLESLKNFSLTELRGEIARLTTKLVEITPAGRRSL